MWEATLCLMIGNPMEVQIMPENEGAKRFPNAGEP
jgi:hypothetical protein